MSGLSLANVIVDAGATSGTRAQARAALAHNRPVFLWHELLEQSWARELAARPGVRAYARPEEITDLLEHSALLERGGL